MWPGERMDRAELELERGVEGARGPCGPEKEWTGLSWNEVWREPEDRVARRKKEWTGLSWNEVWRSQRTVWPGERMDRAELE